MRIELESHFLYVVEFMLIGAWEDREEGCRQEERACDEEGGEGHLRPEGPQR